MHVFSLPSLLLVNMSVYSFSLCLLLPSLVSLLSGLLLLLCTYAYICLFCRLSIHDNIPPPPLDRQHSSSVLCSQSSSGRVLGVYLAGNVGAEGNSPLATVPLLCLFLIDVVSASTHDCRAHLLYRSFPFLCVIIIDVAD